MPKKPAKIQPGFVWTQEELAHALGITPRWLTELLRKPGAPGKTENGYSIEAMRAFQSIDKRAKEDEGARAYREARWELDLRQRRADAEMRETLAAEQAGRMAPIDEVIEVVSGMIRALERECVATAADIANMGAGRSQSEILAVAKDKLRALRKKMALGGWAKKKAFYRQLYEAVGALHKSLDLGNGRNPTSISPEPE